MRLVDCPGGSRMRANLMSGLGRGAGNGVGPRACSPLHLAYRDPLARSVTSVGSPGHWAGMRTLATASSTGSRRPISLVFENGYTQLDGAPGDALGHPLADSIARRTDLLPYLARE
jgi:hypothetical protein